MAERYVRNRNAFIAMMVLGLIFIPGSFGLRNTEAGWGAVFALSSLGIMFFITGIIGSILTRIEYKQRKEKQEKLQSSRSVKRLSDIEIERLVKGASDIDLKEFEKEKGVEYNLNYTVILDMPSKAICIISKTEIKKEDIVLQCSNCQNYYLSKYLLGWLRNNDKCPICQFNLLEKKK